MRHKGLACAPVACDDIENALWQPCLMRDLRKKQRGKRCPFGGFEHHRISGGQGRGDFPSKHQKREIPWDDLPAYAQRGHVRTLAFHQLCKASVMVEMTMHQRNIDVARFADRFAIVEAFEH